MTYPTLSKAELLGYAQEVYADYGALPNYLIEDAYNDRVRRSDVVTAFRNGKEWLIDPLIRAQPRTGKVLLAKASAPYLAVNRFDGPPHYHAHLVVFVDDFAVEVRRRPWNQNPDDPGYFEWIEHRRLSLSKKWGRPMHPEQRQISLPDPIRQAYYHRIDGLSIPLSPVLGSWTRLLPFPVDRPWISIDHFLTDIKLGKKLSAVEQMIPGIRPASKLNAYTNFMMFLDSRESLSGREGDALFVRNHVQDGTVYYLRDGAIEDMSILEAPGEAVDRYCEHVLLRREGRFDFRPFSVPLT